jgi:general L-amino acid transport system permease protein
MTAGAAAAADLSPPPEERGGPVGWARRRLFASPANAVTTLLCAAFLAWVLPPLIRWAIVDATWTGETREACAAGGACWVFVRQRIGQFTYGFYPADQIWRVNLAGALVAALLAPLFLPRFPAKRMLGLVAVVVLPPVVLWLLLGGSLGLPYVETRVWGGLMLTAFMSLYGALISVPLGILLALGRQSELPVVRTIAVIFIEFWRGVPIIAVIFLASVLLPLIVPVGIDVDRVLRALIGLALVIAAYMAEVVRGGLQAIPAGQYEAARALGLGYWRMTGLVVLPQALRIVIPGLVNEFISLIKNTTLVLIVSLFDLLGIVQAALADPKWVGLNMAAYVFAGVVFWLVCWAISRWSLGLERRLAQGNR